MYHQLEDMEEGHSAGDRFDSSQISYALLRQIRYSFKHHRPKSYPPSNIPRTSPERLALASPDSPDGTSATTVLYLAYGSNLSSEAFLDRLDIHPLSRINVSSPGFDLAFDLPGLPYWEPRLSNVTPRKIPRPPIPGDPPKPPFPPPTTNTALGKEEADEDERLGTRLLPTLPPGGPPSWSKGLYGVVYEITRDDYGKLLRAEGGGTAYQDVFAPCLALPPPLRIPEKPPIPELPKPFLAHTLYAPRLSDIKPPGDDRNNTTTGGNDDGGDGDGDKDKWWRKLLLPVSRSTPDYAQPSIHHLNLIRNGAREHYLPDDYQRYLAGLQPYKITTWRQDIGRWLLLLLALPLFLIILAFGYLLADEDGKVPRWVAGAAAVAMNLVWIAYDAVFKPLFGDGERTIEDDEDNSRINRRSRNMMRNSQRWGSEKNALLAN
ncbi:uncharacterized protein F4822DRAFT_387343 [Hypoxylon trugodes]|uniref:uncharacterized protein n=1 Tax=Hypoxylon trugodes TaxID=326681 RepID=UPI00219C0DE9|nr:uncharacterized protein F4822DRAFT_387343 [Hypoxylon trugodes]KAI1394181.1 hypothetical protein F4822DRAFT_387343 [Hypoxylon trugodes]